VWHCAAGPVRRVIVDTLFGRKTARKHLVAPETIHDFSLSRSDEPIVSSVDITVRCGAHREENVLSYGEEGLPAASW
jgi:hypothetical protein